VEGSIDRLGFQLILAFSVLQLPPIQRFFEFIGKMFIKVLDFTKEGSEFLLGGLLNVDSMGFIFAFQILPTIIFFSALTSVLFYLGIIQKVVYGLAWLMTKLYVCRALKVCLLPVIFSLDRQRLHY
jgi:concentrative nucleoside transporter, CNT family